MPEVEIDCDFAVREEVQDQLSCTFIEDVGYSRTTADRSAIEAKSVLLEASWLFAGYLLPNLGRFCERGDQPIEVWQSRKS